MLVDINLLPRKEYRNRANLFLVILIVIVALVGFLFVFLQLNKAHALEKDLNNQLVTVQAARVAAEEEGAVSNNSNSVLQLERTAEWADAYFVETVPILNHLTKLLPERGFVQSFTYSDTGVISFEVQFDTNTEVAHYLALLNESPNFESVKLFTVSTSPLTEEVNEEDVGQGNETNNESNPTNTEGNVTLPNNATKTDANDNILPRYYAQFELIINKAAFNTIEKEGD
ncbi:PilN domain-containing protein [Bacillus sp. REN16]|uniref:PilN domain-containing protein n=1 Tax=Bacillus sp. REN16 TaxID=2887296 RepID=UPI001E47304F|nr:PilN domain-containing protein [Bacillus sp. REN16]MCC3356553.1 PilN domain-containing protein [Bacillus sp. REN16]